MNNQKRIFFKNILWATVLILLIGMMSCASFQERNSRQEVCYIADFSDLHVKIYPQASVSKEGICYHDFLLKLNDTSFQKSWLWRAGDTQEECDKLCGHK